MTIQVRTQAELDAAIHGTEAIELVSGDFSLTLRGTASPYLIVNAKVSLSVEAWGSSQPRVEARESSQPRVEALESSQPRVEAWESSQPRVVAWGSSQPRVEAWGYAQLSVLGKVIAKCAATVAVLIAGKGAKVTGGKRTRIDISTPRKWCDYYGVEVKAGIATLYKSVNADWSTDRARNVGISYAPGQTPEAPDWDGGKIECGAGLHFSPTPAMALEFNNGAHFVACPVRLADMAVHPDGSYPQKCKAKRVAKPIYEVNEDGKRI